MKVYDMHCHVGFAPNVAAHVSGLDTLDVVSLCATVLPSEYQALCEAAVDWSSVALGVGVHPWWVAQGLYDEHEVSLLHEVTARIACEGGTPRIVAEIGLDFSPKWKSSCEAQVNALRQVFNMCEETGVSWLYSIHNVKADNALLDAIEGLSPDQNRIILHSFNGSCEGLHRALRNGCYFSVGERFLTSKKGREYLKAIPLERVVLETDLPCRAGDVVSPEDVHRSLMAALNVMVERYGEDAIEHIRETSEGLLLFAQ